MDDVIHGRSKRGDVIVAGGKEGRWARRENLSLICLRSDGICREQIAVRASGHTTYPKGQFLESADRRSRPHLILTSDVVLGSAYGQLHVAVKHQDSP